VLAVSAAAYLVLLPQLCSPFVPDVAARAPYRLQVIFETSPETQVSAGVTPEEMAVAMTIQSFEDADLNGDGKLSLDEFERWFAQGALGGGAARGVSGSDADSNSCNSSVVDAAVAPTDNTSYLDYVRSVLKFDSLPIEDIMGTFDKYSDADGNMSLPVFHGCIHQLLRRQGATSEVSLYAYTRQRTRIRCFRSLPPLVVRLLWLWH
jgi:hypothetical protein